MQKKIEVSIRFVALVSLISTLISCDSHETVRSSSPSPAAPENTSAQSNEETTTTATAGSRTTTVIESAQQTIPVAPESVDLADKLEWYMGFEADEFTVSVILAHTIKERNKQPLSPITSDQQQELFSLLSEETALRQTGESDGGKELDITIYVPSNVRFTVLCDDSVSVRLNNERYISRSQKLLSYIYKLADIAVYDETQLADTKSATIRYLKDGNVLTKEIKHRDTLEHILNLLASAERTMAGDTYNKPDVELELHTGERDILIDVLTDIGSGEPLSNITVNRYYWLDSKEAAEYIRSLIKDS